MGSSKLCDEEFRNLCGSSSIVWAVKATPQRPWNTVQMGQTKELL
jgi:hypothetical protein